MVKGLGQGETQETPATEEQAQGQSQEAEAQTTPSELDNFKKGFYTKSEELAQFKRDYAWADNFKNELDRDPGLRSHIESYYAPNSDDEQGEARPNPTPAVQNAIDATSQRLQSIETKLFDREIQDKFNEITQEGLPLNEDIRNKVLEEAFMTRNPDVKAIYLKQNYPKIVDLIKKQATDDVAGKIQKNRQAYSGSPGGPAAASEPDIAGMSKDEWDKAILDDIAKSLSE